MRAGLSTIQQTLTPDAAGVLNQSISEAARRNHAQTTPLHVAATLLASPSGLLRQACARSHLNSAHPLQCRALELCFSVALDRVAASAGGASAAPPISNALMAALKRAQANQRRGCPEQLQQPLLAVKVELEQLVLSILDDPSVSRVMREASFSSVAVKAAVEQSLATTSSSSSAPSPPAGGIRGLVSRAPTTTTSTTMITPLMQGAKGSPYMNPRLQAPQRQLARSDKEDEEVKKVLEIFQRNKKRNPILVGDSELEHLMKEVLKRIEHGEGGETFGNICVLHLDKEFSPLPVKLKKLADSIESRSQLGCGIVVNLGDLKWLVEAGNQEHHQLVSDANRKAVVEIGRLLGRGGRVWLTGTANCATYLRCQVYHPTMENDWDLHAMAITPRAQPHPARGEGNGILTSSIESLVASRLASLSQASRRTASSPAAPKLKPVISPLPAWMQAAKPLPQIREESPKDHNTELNPPTQVKTDLVLGHPESKDVGLTLDLFTDAHKGELRGIADVDDYKKLSKGLTEAVSWQPEVASSVALTVTQSRSGHGKRRPSGNKPDTWLLFMGPDKVGKRKMAAALSNLLFNAPPVIVSLTGSDGRSRGKTAIDRLVEALRQSPFSVFLLEDVDAADVIVQGTIRRAIEKGRLPDIHGREVPLGAAVFVLTSASLPEKLNSSDMDAVMLCEEKLEAAAASTCHFEFLRHEKPGSKRPTCGSGEGQRCNKQRKELSLDLNLAVGASSEEENERGSRNSSDLTCESGMEHVRLGVNRRLAGSLPEGVVNGVDLAVAFKPVDFLALRRKVAEGLVLKFESMGGGGTRWSLEVDEEVLDCVVGSLWFGGDRAAEEVEGRLEGVLAEGIGRGGDGVARLAAVGRGW